MEVNLSIIVHLNLYKIYNLKGFVINFSILLFLPFFLGGFGFIPQISSGNSVQSSGYWVASLVDEYMVPT